MRVCSRRKADLLVIGREDIGQPGGLYRSVQDHRYQNDVLNWMERSFSIRPKLYIA